jgi:hypothetical protein
MRVLAYWGSQLGFSRLARHPSCRACAFGNCVGVGKKCVEVAVLALAMGWRRGIDSAGACTRNQFVFAWAQGHVAWGMRPPSQDVGGHSGWCGTRLGNEEEEDYFCGG